ncbi:DUF4224 domain-containing protein [Idiomarina sp.]|uniref:DUF4224 domain-containing protein n=1 Tax=Idiomarina sp. TaxID=1874361 RepID=UPI00258C45F6|nr:DUF4224 domain-containing protein [Idiomarina sp.]
MNKFLTHEEIIQLTACKTRSGQIAILRKNGIKHIIKNNGWPAVTWQQVNAPFTDSNTGSESFEPNYSALLN